MLTEGQFMDSEPRASDASFQDISSFTNTTTPYFVSHLVKDSLTVFPTMILKFVLLLYSTLKPLCEFMDVTRPVS